jgi:hypothetical protein
MKKYLKINFGEDQKFIFNGKFNGKFYETDERQGLLDRLQNNEISTEFREATQGVIMFGSFEILMPPASWRITITPDNLFDTSNLKIKITEDIFTLSGYIIVLSNIKDNCLTDLTANLSNAFVSEVSIWDVVEYSKRNPYGFSLTGHWKSDNELLKEIIESNTNSRWSGSIEILPKKPKL